MIHIHSLVGIIGQKIKNKALRLFLYSWRSWKYNFRQFLHSLTIFHNLLDVTLKGRLSEQDFVCKNAKAPRVNFVSVALLKKLFRRGVLKASNYCVSKACFIVVNRASKVSDFDITLNYVSLTSLRNMFYGFRSR